MSSSMPEFEMPPERVPATSGEPGGDGPHDGAAVGAPTGDAGLDGAGRGDERQERRRGRRRLVVGVAAVAAIAIVAGSAAVTQDLERRAAEADVAALTEATLAYVGALEDGRAEEATALVPVVGDASLLVDAVLGAADRIAEAEVVAVEVEGDAARVELAYRSTSGPVGRTLEAERRAEGWALVTSLAEPIALDPAQIMGLRPTIAGVEVVEAGRLLYPGVYRTDAVERALWATEPMALPVDGDPRTPVVAPEVPIVVGSVPFPEAFERSRAHFEACQLAGSCPIADGALAEQGSMSLLDLGADGSVTMQADLLALRSSASGLTELRMGVRAATAEDGEVVWECTNPTLRDEQAAPPFVPCAVAP
ncbi:hypothetical protein OVA14_06355 [Agrococcus sp. SL85]|uniref:hypothetical protein n=1 Tax=Agrococcus sp. SL85 TaxID=2995141 RepID=UPI00226D2698|nr:hypothetical protein [Agrococcus sp. SL85]WAC67350.1 hypothetical protein OVA14_06355 [Agrococcus sp. SL85]